MEDNKMYITKEVIENKEHSEIHYSIRDELGFDYDNEELELVELFQGDTPSAINEPININLLIMTLQKMKEKGSTHVAIGYHTDHIGYEMTGYKIYHSTEEQIRNYEEKLKKKLDKEKKLKALREEYSKIANEQD